MNKEKKNTTVFHSHKLITNYITLCHVNINTITIDFFLSYSCSYTSFFSDFKIQCQCTNLDAIEQIINNKKKEKKIQCTNKKLTFFHLYSLFMIYPQVVSFVRSFQFLFSSLILHHFLVYDFAQKNCLSYADIFFFVLFNSNDINSVSLKRCNTFGVCRMMKSLLNFFLNSVLKSIFLILK